MTRTHRAAYDLDQMRQTAEASHLTRYRPFVEYGGKEDPMSVEDDRRSKPLIYSCSGCSSAAQMANSLAVRADRNGFAEMSCIAGVGGDVPALLRVAKSGRPMLVIDGCGLACAKNCLARHGVEPSAHIILTRMGVRKEQHGDFSPERAEELFKDVQETLLAIEERLPKAQGE